MEEYNNIPSRYDAVAKQAGNFGIDAQRWYTVFDLKCQIALALGADVQDVKDCLSVYDVDYLIYKTYGGTLSKLDLMSDYDVLVATIAVLDNSINTSLIDSEYIAEKTLIDLMVPMTNEYFYVEPLSDNTEFRVYRTADAPTLNLEYSLDGKTWQRWDYASNNIKANAKERVYLRGQNDEWTTIVGGDGNTSQHDYNSIISASKAQFNIGGRLSSLFNGNDEESDKSMIMTMIFNGSSCVDASELIVPKNTKLSYAFYGCESLLSAPRTLSDSIFYENQYTYMFAFCKSLTRGPELPAATLTSSCYNSLFRGCTSLTNAPKLPALTLADNCYNSLFYGCKSLTNAPELPALTLADNCYNSLFFNCTSLTNAPELPALTLADNCYNSLFCGCTSLTNAPELPALTLASHSYYRMFSNCTSLKQAPQMQAEHIKSYSCREMFRGCTSLTSFNFGNQSIFTDSADSLSYMFLDCSKLSYIRCLYSTKSGVAPREFTKWTSRVAPQGTFVTNTNKWKRGVNGIPEGWDVVIEGASA